MQGCKYNVNIPRLGTGLYRVECRSTATVNDATDKCAHFFFYATPSYNVIPVRAVSSNEAAAIFSYKLRSDGRGRVGDGFPTENRLVPCSLVLGGRSRRETKWDESATDIDCG